MLKIGSVPFLVCLLTLLIQKKQFFPSLRNYRVRYRVNLYKIRHKRNQIVGFSYIFGIFWKFVFFSRFMKKKKDFLVKFGWKWYIFLSFTGHLLLKIQKRRTIKILLSLNMIDGEILDSLCCKGAFGKSSCKKLAQCYL